MTAQLAPAIVFRDFDSNGVPLAFGSVFTYIAGTTTPQATYVDSTQTTQNTNPVLLNNRGEASIWIDPTKVYKFKVVDQAGNQVHIVDQVQGSLTSAALIALLTQQFLGAILYPQTKAEADAPVVPANFGYSTIPFADVRRYGCICDGVTDDTAALQIAFNTALVDSVGLVLPSGLTCKITSYVQMPSNTTFLLLGILSLTGRVSGLFANNAVNISVYGNKIGVLRDSTVQSTYVWNNGITNTAPAIHIRSCSHVTIDGLNFNYCSQGVFTSNANANYEPPGTPFSPVQAYPVDVKIRDCSMTFCEWSGCATLSSYDSGYHNNYVYRCGDGGMWMMGAERGEIIGNHRVSPQTVYADTLAHGQNAAAFPTTWNDVQGIQLEGCHDMLVANNIVEFIQGEALDIKQNCNRILCTGNRISSCEQFGITVREGDPGDLGANYKVVISNNVISNHGYTMFSTTPQTALAAAISVSSGYNMTITGNTIFSYQTTPGIYCAGPGQYQVNQYGANQQQAALTVTGNAIEFMGSNPFDLTEFSFTASTLGAIVVAGQYTSVKVDNNVVKTDRYYYSDTRINAAPAISMTVVFPAWVSTTAYVVGNVVYTGAGGGIYTCTVNNTNSPPPSANWTAGSSGASSGSSFYPTVCSISNNEIQGWGFTGIDVQGQPVMGSSGLTVNGNTIGGVGGWGINLKSTNYAVCSNNSVSQSNNSLTGGYAGINISGVSGGTAIQGVVASGNSVYGPWNIGGNNMAYCIQISYCSDINLANNKMANFVTGALNFITPTGNFVLSGSTGFPRTGAGTPNGSVTSFYIGEQYFDTTNLKWWAASTFQSTVWTQLSN